ncbi:VCBS repeat-containing protein [Arenibacter sp. BSSL-BM3]|uniref:VCBS repeat-containing protein n=1 Tax=Arenibacter arenosicollis TaxID=2762274 RepID=A0ABR7QTW5_9FLAO|nr:VCBS repeat-containing protein [Arenibacter arenosicollis]MBC8770524.1 VCBS repeat-containing protein [Arenibacter arenosicollis]
MSKFLFPVLMVLLYISCNTSADQNSNGLFEKLSADRSGIDFSNNITENDSINYFSYLYLYMGGGVAIGDFNNDGLQDIYLTGNMVENKLYLNKGNLQFEDISKEAGVAADNRWVTGVTLGDANQDGWLDIYVSVSGKWVTRKNLLYINDAKVGANPTFTESAENYGVADTGNTTQAVFFDFDLDGDQDLYVANYPMTSPGQNMEKYLNYTNLGTPYDQSDRLYRNDGMGKFTDVTQEANLAKYGLSLGVSVGDFNQDGWPDLYVCNDFVTPDYFLINNKDGSFSDKNLKLTNHTSYFSMGSDVADFNNDGLLDLLQVDMLPKSNSRIKENMASMDTDRFYEIVSNGLHHQYSTNTLQLNMGNDKDGLPRFGDVARMSGLSSTDWSWAPLFADFDNDGFKDVYITNGVRRDINNQDFFKVPKEEMDKLNDLQLTKKLPFEKIRNFAFKNNADLSFKDIGQQWGIDYEGFSNGVAYADLDNDGDLDLVVNNLDDKSIIYENKASDRKLNNFLRVKMNGPKDNAFGLGCKIWLEDNGETQFQELTLTRGFQSSVEPILHFGLGKKNSIDKVRILWQDGKEQILEDVGANQLLAVDYNDAKTKDKFQKEGTKQSFEDITEQVQLKFKHEENPFNDFTYQVLLPHKTSEYGPALAVGDIDNNGLDDIYIGGAYGQAGKMYYQNEEGIFIEILNEVWESDKKQEDVGAIFFDANGDGLQDLYVVSGGNEAENESDYYQDRLYINEGQGKFRKNTTALPIINSSGSCVIAGDFDNDGDTDLFVGGRLTPRNYPVAPRSYILRNESTASDLKFVDVTEEIAPGLAHVGMVTKAEWVDFDDDSYLELMVVGEWMPISYFNNVNGKFVNETEKIGFSGTNGWWFGMISEDFDSDGDLDFVMGNLGLNYKYQATENEPFSIYMRDFDRNNKNDIVLSYYESGTEYPVRGKGCSSEQIPVISYKFKDYKSFAAASLADVYTTDELKESLQFKVGSFASVYIENLGGHKFKINPLDNLAQISSINSLLAEDFDNDGNMDMVIGGNLYGSEVETPRNDSSFGALIVGNGKGSFSSKMPYESGLMVKGEVKAIEKIKLAGGQAGILFAKNNDYLQLFKISK